MVMIFLIQTVDGWLFYKSTSNDLTFLDGHDAGSSNWCRDEVVNVLVTGRLQATPTRRPYEKNHWFPWGEGLRAS